MLGGVHAQHMTIIPTAFSWIQSLSTFKCGTCVNRNEQWLMALVMAEHERLCHAGQK